MTQRYPLMQISPEEIDFADFNPRGEKPAEIESDPTFDQLKDSVYKYGVLVPIVVHKQNATKPYRLVDGERRVRAALATKTKKIPAHVATTKSDLDDLIQAFHIHMLRKQWRAVAQAKALKKIMAKLEAQGIPPKSNELLEELRVATGCTESQLKALRRAIQFPDHVLQEVDEGKLGWSHLIQIEESFTEPLHDKFPELSAEIGGKHARKMLVEKARQRILTSTRALMDNVLPVITRTQTEDEKAFTKKLLHEFVSDVNMPAEQVLQRYEKEYPTSGKNWAELGKDILDCSVWLNEMLDGVSTNMVRGYPKLTKDVQESLNLLKKKIGKIVDRITKVTE